MAIDYALKDFDDKHDWSIARSWPTRIKDIKHLHVVLVTIDYALKSFDDEHCQSIARIITNMNSNNAQPVAQ